MPAKDANLKSAPKLAAELSALAGRMEIAVMALIDIRDSSAYDVCAKARAAIALEKLEIF